MCYNEGNTEVKMNNNPEAGKAESPRNESGYQSLTSLGEFNPDAAMNERKKAEAELTDKNSAEKTREHFAESINVANQYIEEMDELLNSGSTDNKRINSLANKISELLEAADKDNETVKDSHYAAFRKNNFHL